LNGAHTKLLGRNMLIQLFDYGFDCNEKHNDLTAVMECIQNDNLEVLKILINYGIDGNIIYQGKNLLYVGCSMMHFVLQSIIEGKNSKILRFMLENKEKLVSPLNLETTNINGSSVLDMARSYNL